MMKWVYTLPGILFSANVCASEVISSHVEHEDNRYVVEVDMRIKAQPDKVYALITAYDKLKQLNSDIEKSELISSVDEKNHRVLIVSDICILFFCKTITQLQDIVEVNKEVIIATVIPEKSSFDYAHARWYIRKEGVGTRITFNSDLKPSFWVPPVFGPSLIKGKLENEVLDTIDTLEKLANNHDPETIQ
jgi:hypothetical protein